MDQIDLFHLRQLWVALFRSGFNIDSSAWRGWSDHKISSLEGVPGWVLNLSTADDKDEAMDAVRDDMVREYALIGAEALNDEALLIGFVYERYAAGEIPASTMWVTLNRELDFAQFMDDEKWKQFSQCEAPATRVAGAAEDKEEAEVAKKLAPLGAFVRQQANERLQMATFP